MKWLTNTRDPRLPDAKDSFIQAYKSMYDDVDKRWEEWTDFLKDKIIGNPQATDSFSVEYLKSIKYVGVYAKD